MHATIGLLEDVIADGWQIPFSNEVCVDRIELAALAAELPLAAAPKVDELKAVAAAAKPVPLTRRTRVNRRTVLELCRAIRADLRSTPADA